MENYNRSHPEKRINEVFIANIRNIDFSLIIFKSKRRGLTAYDFNGEKIDSENFFPVFASSSEVGQVMKNLGVVNFEDLDVFKKATKTNHSRHLRGVI